ncbi:MAG: hypothetical protein A3H43_04480 [Gammaproteobacteria bacterium RIFCSPLOWO2_02_FULL_42_9]|nr:MAG: hypothetical protein A3H43_04480 [Gammaproteobacteria bacterium RIFCSPLOWO2_02_FULL_42_9]
MLQSIRDKSQGWFAWVVVTVIGLTFALWGVHSYLYSNQLQSVVAKVNGVKITQQDLDQAYNQLKRQKQLQWGANYSVHDQSEQELKSTALEGLVSSLVVHQGISQAGFAVGPELLEVTLAKMPIFQLNGVFSKERFQRLMDDMLYSPDEFLAQMKDQILMTELKVGLANTNFSLPGELKQAVELIKQKRQFSYVVVPMSRFMSQVKLTPDAISQYYDSHKDDFTLPEKVSVDYIELSLAQLMKQEHPSQQEIQQFYQDHISAFTRPAQWNLQQIFIRVPADATQQQLSDAKQKITKITQALNKGTNFGAVAQTYSDNPALATPVWITADQVDPMVQGILMKTHDNNTVSAPVRAEQGYVIVKILNTRSAKVFSFADVRDKVTAEYAQQKAEAKFSDLNDQLSNVAYENPHTLAIAAKQLNLPIQSTELFSREGGATAFTKNLNVINAAFDDDVLLQNNNSNPINLNDNDVVVLRINKHVPTIVKPLSDVKATIIKTLTQQAALKQIKQWSDALVQKIQQGMSLQQAASQNGLSIQQVAYIAQHSSAVEGNILNAVFEMPRVDTKNKNNVSDVQLPSNDVAVIVLEKVQTGDRDALSAANKKVFESSLKNNMGILDYQLYVNGLLQIARIEREDEKS